MQDRSSECTICVVRWPILFVWAFFATMASAQVSFRPPKDITDGAVSGISSMDAGDIDGDGRLDVVIAPAEAYRKGGDHDLAWYRNPGGDYDMPWPKTVIRVKVNNHHTIKLGDMDRDGDLDVVVGVAWGSQAVHIYYNDGRGLFREVHTVHTGKGLYSGILADLGNDGDLDIVGQETYANQSKPWVYESLLAGGGR